MQISTVANGICVLNIGSILQLVLLDLTVDSAQRVEHDQIR